VASPSIASRFMLPLIEDALDKGATLLALARHAERRRRALFDAHFAGSLTPMMRIYSEEML